METLYEEREVKVLLTRDEKLQIGEEMAREYLAISLVEAEKAEASSRFKARIEGHAKVAAEKAGLLSNGYQFRIMKCEKVFDMKAGKVNIIRPDTQEIVYTRDVTDQERQRVLALPKKGETAAPQPTA